MEERKATGGEEKKRKRLDQGKVRHSFLARLKDRIGLDWKGMKLNRKRDTGIIENIVHLQTDYSIDPQLSLK